MCVETQRQINLKNPVKKISKSDAFSGFSCWNSKLLKHR
jgi:hypothetical protein